MPCISNDNSVINLLSICGPQIRKKDDLARIHNDNSQTHLQQPKNRSNKNNNETKISAKSSAKIGYCHCLRKEMNIQLSLPRVFLVPCMLILSIVLCLKSVSITFKVIYILTYVQANETTNTHLEVQCIQFYFQQCYCTNIFI